MYTAQQKAQSEETKAAKEAVSEARTEIEVRIIRITPLVKLKI